MILLFTDYGLEGPYLGQVEAVISRMAPGERIVNLMADAPRNNPRASAYLLAALAEGFPEGTILFSVVDPGVGTGAHEPVVLDLDGRLFVGPDNGLFDIAARRAAARKARRIQWRPTVLSDSFHGRDLYAPACAMLARGEPFDCRDFHWQDGHGWPDDLWEAIYVDRFGNVMTGVRACQVQQEAILLAGGQAVAYVRTFALARPGQVFWYANSSGLVELAVNGASAAAALKLRIGDPLQLRA